MPYWGTYTFNFQVTAPINPGTYTFEWGMFHTSRRWFGYTSPLTITVREPINNAELLGQNVPNQVRTGQRHEVTVTMRNNGETSWTRAQQYTLMSQSPHNSGTWGVSRVPLPVETVNPGESATFRFDVTAPATAGQYASQWGMQREGHGSFGGSSVPVTVNVTDPVNNAAPWGQNVPAQMETGKPYTVSVTMYNNGETTWNRAQQYTLMAQSPHNTTTWGFNRVPLPVDNIAPGQSTTFTFNVTAPNAPGSYPFQWGMQREGYGSFGPGTNVAMINVVAPPPLVNNAEVVGISVPARMQTQLNYNVAVTMRNNGTTTWSPGALYRLGSHDNQIWGPGRIELTSAVAPGQQYTFNFQVTAPASGEYQMQWGMVQDGVQWFGAAAGSPVLVTEDLSRVTFIHTDGLGSPVARTDGAGTVLSRTRYEPYGYVAAGATPTIGFTGHVNDADTGLTYMQQRYYDPVAGRFLSIDPVTTDANTGGSFNRYNYANNNPFSYIDPDGRDAEAPIDRRRNEQEEKERARCNANCNMEIDRSSGSERTWGSYLPGTAQGHESSVHYADRINQSSFVEDPMARVGLGLSVLWTPDTAVSTAFTLGTAGFGPRARAAVFGPLKQWIRIGPSFSKASQAQVAMSIRWGASPIGNGKYIALIPSQTMQRFNQWLRIQTPPGSGWRSADPGHFHLW